MGVFNSTCCCKGHDDDKTSVGFYRLRKDEEEAENEIINKQLIGL